MHLDIYLAYLLVYVKTILRQIARILQF